MVALTNPTASVRRPGLAQPPIEQTGELGETIGSFRQRPRLLAEDGRIPTETAGTEADREATAGDVVECDDLASERDRVPKVR